MVRVIQCTVIRENHAAFVNKPVWCKYTNERYYIIIEQY